MYRDIIDLFSGIFRLPSRVLYTFGGTNPEEGGKHSGNCKAMNEGRRFPNFFYTLLCVIAVVSTLTLVTSIPVWQMDRYLTKNALPWSLAVSPALAADENEAPADAPNEGAEGEVNPCPECPECPDPATFVLEGLEARKEALRIEEEALKDERKALESYKEEIDEKLEKLEALKKQISEDLDRIQKVKDDKALAKEREETAAFEKKMDEMASVYAKMDPEKAGAVFDKMDLKVASEIISRIPVRKASKLMENINEMQAAKISERLAHKVGKK